MAKLIIVCGLPATGKTTLADELSQRTGIFFLHKDSVKESLYESMGMSTLEDSMKIGYPSVKTILDLARENLSRGVDVILESPFHFSQDGSIFEQWRTQYEIDIYTIILSLGEEERRKRFEQRERDKCHHDNERIRTFQKTKVSYDHMPEKKLYLRTKQSKEETVNEVMNFVFGN